MTCCEQKVSHVAHVLRETLATSGVVCLGKPGPLVPVLLGREAVGRITAALCFDGGVFANLIEYPAVSVGACRLRMQVMATHTGAQAQQAAEVIGRAYRFAEELISRADAAQAQVLQQERDDQPPGELRPSYAWRRARLSPVPSIFRITPARLAEVPCTAASLRCVRTLRSVEGAQLGLRGRGR